MPAKMQTRHIFEKKERIRQDTIKAYIQNIRNIWCPEDRQNEIGIMEFEN